MPRRPAETYPLDLAYDVGNEGWNLVNSRGQTLLQMHCSGSATIVCDTSNILHRAAAVHLRKSRRQTDEARQAYHAGIAHGLRRGIQAIRAAAHRMEHED